MGIERWTSYLDFHGLEYKYQLTIEYPIKNIIMISGTNIILSNKEISIMSK